MSPLYRGVRIIEVGNVWFLAFLGPNELSVIERCPYYRGVRKERFDCTTVHSISKFQVIVVQWRQRNETKRVPHTITSIRKRHVFFFFCMNRPSAQRTMTWNNRKEDWKNKNSLLCDVIAVVAVLESWGSCCHKTIDSFRFGDEDYCEYEIVSIWIT